MRYKIISSKIEIESKKHRVYGIKIGAKRILDISPNSYFVKKLADKLNRNRVPVEHFENIVEDCLI